MTTEFLRPPIPRPVDPDAPERMGAKRMGEGARDAAEDTGEGGADE